MMVFVISAYATRAIDVQRPGFVQIKTALRAYTYDEHMDLSKGEDSSCDLLEASIQFKKIFMYDHYYVISPFI